MTIPATIMALFCEDIREEKSGQLSLIGVMLDNAVISVTGEANAVRGIIPKLAIYLRAGFDADATVNQITFTLEMPTGEKVPVGHADTITIEEAKRTREKGNPIATVVSFTKIQPLLIEKVGRILIHAQIDDQSQIVGFLNIIPEQVSP